MIGTAEDNGSAPIGKPCDESPTKCDAVAGDDNGADIVQGYAADFLTSLLDQQEAPRCREMESVGGDIDNSLILPVLLPYSRGPGSKTLPSGSMRT